MKIKFLVSMAGPGQHYDAGDVAEIDREEAARLIEAGIAIPHAPEPVKEIRRKG